MIRSVARPLNDLTMSAILSADDLNDFISPGVACIKPIETLPSKSQEEENTYSVTKEDKIAPAPVAISLTDCLACSGCVTSAEAVLVSLQSPLSLYRGRDIPSCLVPQRQCYIYLVAAACRVLPLSGNADLSARETFEDRQGRAVVCSGHSVRQVLQGEG